GGRGSRRTSMVVHSSAHPATASNDASSSIKEPAGVAGGHPGADVGDTASGITGTPRANRRAEGRQHGSRSTSANGAHDTDPSTPSARSALPRRRAQAAAI